MNKKDLQILKNKYHGVGKKMDCGWFQEVDKLEKENNIKKIYEVWESGYLGAWYMVVAKDNSKIIIQHSINDVNTQWMMSQFKNECHIKAHNWERVEVSILS